MENRDNADEDEYDIARCLDYKVGLTGYVAERRVSVGFVSQNPGQSAGKSGLLNFANDFRRMKFMGGIALAGRPVSASASPGATSNICRSRRYTAQNLRNPGRPSTIPGRALGMRLDRR